MDRRQKTLSVSFAFIPAIYHAGRWVLGVIGDVQTAADVVRIEGVWINWPLLSHWLAMAAALYIIYLNWDIITFKGWREEQRRQKNKYGDVGFPDAVNYLVWESRFGSSLHYKAKFQAAAKAIQDKVLKGELDIYGVYIKRSANQEKVLLEDIKNLEWDVDYLQERIVSSSSVRCVSSAVLKSGREIEIAHLAVSRMDLVKHWP